MHVVDVLARLLRRKQTVGRNLDLGDQLVVLEQAEERVGIWVGEIDDLGRGQYPHGIKEGLDAVVDIAAVSDQIPGLVTAHFAVVSNDATRVYQFLLAVYRALHRSIPNEG